MTKKTLTIVAPCYNEEESLPIFYQTVVDMEEQLSSVDIEFLFVDDGSRDNTLQVCRQLHEKDNRVLKTIIYHLLYFYFRINT